VQYEFIERSLSAHPPQYIYADMLAELICIDRLRYWLYQIASQQISYLLLVAISEIHQQLSIEPA
jgi:hypothetical protein